MNYQLQENLIQDYTYYFQRQEARQKAPISFDQWLKERVKNNAE